MHSANTSSSRLLPGALALILLLLAMPSQGDSRKETPASEATPLRALILSGSGNHDWRATTPFLRQLLEDSGRFEVRVTEAPDGITMRSLAGFDLLVADFAGPRPGSEAEKAIDSFVASGKGLLVTRGGLESPALARLACISWATGTGGGAEDPFRIFGLKLLRADHPVSLGLADGLRTGDRPLRGFTLARNASVLASSDQGTPILIASSSGKGRVFCTTLGHDIGAMQETTFITTLLRGAEWAGNGNVTLSTEIPLRGPATNGVRVLVVTGGHDHEASFYGLFSGYRDIGWVPVTDSALAFKQDLRSKYDVVVFYDFTRDLDDNGKKNLRDFVESGKGVVVLHHGILNFQKWPWWYEEVVGGLYRLERQGSIPNSTVKFGQEHLIIPAGNHPITAGIGPFHVTDETYKGLYISTNVQPLLLTDNPTSDRTVAWIGPCTSSRVVFIQLGHDHSPFRHPSYRALVHNSVLWGAGRLK